MKNLKRIFRDIKRYSKYSVVAAKAELKAEVAGSYLNWVWWILEPFCMMQVYTIVFGNFFHMRTPNFNLFVFMGLTLNGFFQGAVKSSVKIVKRNKPTISKIYLPKYILVLSQLFVSAFKMTMSFSVIIIMMIVERVTVTWNILMIIPVLIDLFLFTYAICLFLSHFGVFVEDLANVVHIVLRFALYFTGVFYNIRDRFPEPYNVLILRFYPVAKLLELARNAVIYGQSINYWYLVVLFGLSTVVSYFGMCLIYKYENTYMKVI